MRIPGLNALAATAMPLIMPPPLTWAVVVGRVIGRVLRQHVGETLVRRQ
jgi:hypothetical protein